MKNSILNIVVVSQNAREYLEFTLSGIFKTVKTPFILTIVDNHSTNDVMDYIQSLRPTGYCQKNNSSFQSKQPRLLPSRQSGSRRLDQIKCRANLFL